MSLINEALKRAEAEKHGQAYQAPECGEGVSPSRPAGIPDRGPLGLPALGSPTNSAKRQATPSQQDLNLAGETTAPRMTSPRRHLVPWAIVAVLALAGAAVSLTRGAHVAAGPGPAGGRAAGSR